MRFDNNTQSAHIELNISTRTNQIFARQLCVCVCDIQLLRAGGL